MIDDSIFPEGVLLLEPADMYDKCIVGVGRRFHDTFVIYDENCVIEAIAADILAGADDSQCAGDPAHNFHSHDEDEDAYTTAREHFEFNTIGGWLGDGTWGFVTKLEDLER